jgi:CheY-like chemotaxis protein
MATRGDPAYKHKVLIVDDETLNIEFLQTLLSEDINVIFATTGEDALAIVQANPPDMILLDIMMPGMDGYEVCKRLKGNPETKDIPVIFVTAKEGPEEEARGLELGAIDYITKPFNPEIVKSKVRNNIIRIATPRPDLAQHHSQERRDPRQDRRASDKPNPWKWLAVAAVVIALIASGFSLVGGGGFQEMFGQLFASDETSTPTPATQKQSSTPADSKSTTKSDNGAPSDNAPAQAPARSTTTPSDMKWVDTTSCPEIPEVPWWRFVSHRSIVRYVERNLEGDWKTYADKWQGRLDGVRDIYSRSSTAITNTGIRLSGPALAEYIEQMQVRVTAINCLRAEAEIQAQK